MSEVMDVNLEEYRKWLKENGNLEEENALGVLEVILRHHTYGTNFKLKGIYPHLWLKGDDITVEFDLLVELEGTAKVMGREFSTTRKIGIEFKEGDVKKVLAQAIARREFVDYIYIATRSWVHLDFDDLFVMGAYGIGWVIWDRDFAKMIVESRWRQPSASLEYMVERAVRAFAEKYMARYSLPTGKTLLDYLRGKD